MVALLHLITNTTADLTKRVVAVTPAMSYPGEEHDYIVTFTAPGPMYGARHVSGNDSKLTLACRREDIADRITVRAPGVALCIPAKSCSC